MTWYKHWFNHPLYLELYSHRDESEARLVVDLVLSATGLRAGDRILDLGSGAGRHAIALAKHGLNVTGADLSPLLLEIAAESSRKTGCGIPFVRADMKHIPFSRAFDCVAQLFTAFGYFISDEENAHVISEVAGVIKPGGWYFLDFLNAPNVTATLTPRTETRNGKLNVVQERDIIDGRVEKTITIYRSGEVEAQFSESVRMFTPEELRAMLEANGFRVVQIFGDYRGMPLTENSPRCILVGKRSEDM